MPNTFKFPPNGYEVTVLRKQDVLDCIEENIIDKEIALDIVRRCEIDATNFLKEGRWAGIPFIGNIRIPKQVQHFMSEDMQKTMQDARENLDKDKYLLFRKQVVDDAFKQIKEDRYYKYEVSKFVGKNLHIFKYLTTKYNDAMARFICFTLREMTPVDEYNV